MRLLLFVTLAGLLLASCGTPPKDYSDATPLDKIDQSLRIDALWLRETEKLPSYQATPLVPAVSADSVYYANVSGEVSALDSTNGSRRWKVSLPTRISAGPGIAGELLIIVTSEAEVIALQQEDGAIRWRRFISGEVLATPQLVEGQVILQTIEGKIIALDLASQKQSWSYSHTIPALTLRGTSKPLIVGNRILAGFADGKLVSLDRYTGKAQWTTTIAVPKGRTDIERLVDIDGIFASDEQVVYVTSYQGGIAALSVADGNILWSRKISSYTGLTLHDGKILVSDNDSYVWCLDARTGGTLWRQDKLKHREISAPVIIDGAVVVGDFDGFVHWMSLENGGFVARQNLALRWKKNRHMLPSQDDTRPVRHSISVVPQVSNNRIYIRDNRGALAAFELKQ